MRNKLWTLAALALVSLAAFAQAPVVGSTIDAKTGFKVNGAAPSGHALCGNGTVYIDSANACGILFYQTIHNPLGTTMPQEPVLTLLGEFTCADFAGASTQCDLAHVGTAGTYANPASVQTDAFGRVINITAGTQIIRTATAAGCSTGTGTGTACSNTLTWSGGGFPDTNYQATCSGGAPFTSGSTSEPNAVDLVGWGSKTTTTINTSTVSKGSDGGASFGVIDCIGIDN